MLFRAQIYAAFEAIKVDTLSFLCSGFVLFSTKFIQFQFGRSIAGVVLCSFRVW